NEVLVDPAVGVLVVENSNAVPSLSDCAKPGHDGSLSGGDLAVGKEAPRLEPIELVVEGDEHVASTAANSGNGDVEARGRIGRSERARGERGEEEGDGAPFPDSVSLCLLFRLHDGF